MFVCAKQNRTLKSNRLLKKKKKAVPHKSNTNRFLEAIEAAVVDV